MKSRLLLFNFFLLIYFFLGYIFYVITNSRPLNFIFNLITDANSVQNIERYIDLFDQKFFYFLPTLPLVLLIILSLINLKKILFSKNFLSFKNEDSDISHLNKYNLNYLIALSAGLGLYLELMIIRLHSSFFQLFAFFKNISLLSCLLGLGIGYLFANKNYIL